MDISLISLRSALSDKRGKEFDFSSAHFLKDLEGEFHFVKDAATPNSLRVFFIESGGAEVPFKAIYQNYRAPYYLLTTGNSNSLASALEILSFLQARHLNGRILYGSPDEIKASLREIAVLERADAYLASSRLGVIGSPSDWLISSSVDFALAKEKFGVDFVCISMEELQSEIDKKEYDSPLITPELRAKAASRDVLEGALAIYGALKRLIKKYNLKGFSIRCFDLLPTRKNTACLALALLNSEGVSAGCEGDEAALLSMHLFRSLGSPSFQCNPSVISPSENSLVLAHCTCPLSMLTSYRFMTHFELGLGIGIRGKFREGSVTLFKLSPKLDAYHLFHGQILQNLEKVNLCRSQIKVQLDGGADALLTSPYGNHLLLAYGDETELLTKLLARHI